MRVISCILTFLLLLMLVGPGFSALAQPLSQQIYFPSVFGTAPIPVDAFGTIDGYFSECPAQRSCGGECIALADDGTVSNGTCHRLEVCTYDGEGGEECENRCTCVSTGSVIGQVDILGIAISQW